MADDPIQEKSSKEYRHQYYLEHRDVALAQVAQYYIEHKDYVRGVRKDHYQNNRDFLMVYQRQYDLEHKVEKSSRHKKLMLKLRHQFFEMYGNRCACCGESAEEFLTLDHLNGLDGKKRPSVWTYYKDATKEYRPDLFRTLCMNCNHSYGVRGYCPHQQKLELSNVR